MRVFRFLGPILAVMGFILSGMGESFAAEEEFPTKPIQVIIPFQPGSTDVVLRAFVDKLPEYLGQPVTFIYKPGAAGSLGAAYVANAKPDGYTLLGTSQSSIIIVPLTTKGLSYTWESFDPVVATSFSAGALCVRSDARWKNLQELVEEARKNPGKISYSSSGTNGVWHIAAEGFCKQAGITLNHIPALGSAPAISALLGGHVDLNPTSADIPYPHVKAGTVRALCVFSNKRVKFYPDVPTASEAGYPVVGTVNFGLLAPKGTRKEIVQKIYLASKKALENHEASIKDQLDKVCNEVDFRNPEEYTVLLKNLNDFTTDMLNKIRK